MANINHAFNKYRQDKNFLDKTEFKCAFIYLTGFKPTKEDIQVAKMTMQGNFCMNKQAFTDLMTVYLK